MRFVIHSSVLMEDEAAFRKIDRIVDRVAEEIHRIDIEDPDQLEASAWYRDARPIHRQVLKAAAAVPPRVKTHSGLHSKRMNIKSAQDAIVADKIAHTPLTVLVEDREADGVLLDLLVKKLGSEELRSIWSATTAPGAVEIQTSGGIGAIPDRIRRALADAQGQDRPVRLFVMCDSDQRWPGDQGADSARVIEGIRELCRDNQVPLQVLKKRTAENYIPDEVFVAIRDDPANRANIDRFNALLRRSVAQRNHFPIKDGLPEAERDQAITAGLYNASDLADLSLLESRLLPRRPRPLSRLHDEREAHFTADGLRARDGIGELDELLNAISQEL
jgi:hypothetical protein